MTSELEIHRDGAYELTTEGDDGGGTIHRNVCTGRLGERERDQLWNAIEHASFVPEDHAHASPIQAPRGKYGQQGRYAILRVDGENATRGPADATTARALVDPARQAVDGAETAAARAPAACKTLPPRKRGQR